MTTERTALWTLSMLTIPSRLPYLGRLLRSIAELDLPRPFDVTVVYNRETEQEPLAIEAEIQAMAPSLPVRVYVNANDTSIVGGRAVQLGVCRTPMLAFIDDDLTLHGDVFGTIERTLRTRPMGIVGLPSFEGDTGEPVKPRDSTPSVRVDGVRYMPVQGMLVAGYRRLFADVGGFNPRRRFWGEWTEFNVRMWRHGFPTGYPLESGASLRHWSAAPESPTRNMGGRERHVLWGLLCTAMEYDAVSINEATEAFWRLAEDRYLAYSFGAVPSAKELLATVLELMPQLAQEFPAIRAFAEETRRHRFQFKPFQDLTEAEVREVLAFATGAIAPYRPEGLLAGA
jgi:hypothetical protein